MPIPHPLSALLQARLGPLPAPARHWIEGARRHALDAGQPLVRAGERWQHLWWVERGALRLFYIAPAGEEWNKNFFLDGSLVWPVTPLMRSQPVMFHVEPLEPTIAWSLELPAHGSGAVADWPAWSTLENATVCQLLDDKMQREHSFLHASAHERYALLLTTRPDWAARIPLRHLASYLGITDVSLSRIRSRMGLNKG